MEGNQHFQKFSTMAKNPLWWSTKWKLDVIMRVQATPIEKISRMSFWGSTESAMTDISTVIFTQALFIWIIFLTYSESSLCGTSILPRKKKSTPQRKFHSRNCRQIEGSSMVLKKSSTWRDIPLRRRSTQRTFTYKVLKKKCEKSNWNWF